MNIQVVTGVVVDKRGWLSTHALPNNMNPDNLYLTLYNKGKVDTWDLVCVWEDFMGSDVYLYGFKEGTDENINQWEGMEPLGGELFYGDMIFVMKSKETGLLLPISTRHIRGLESWANELEDITEEDEEVEVGDYDFDDGFLEDDNPNNLNVSIMDLSN